MYSYCKERAFTLFELMITIIIFAIIAAIAIPYFHKIKENQELSNIFPLIQQHVNIAKHAAVIYHNDTIICGSSSLDSCENNQWNKGLIVFLDINKNKKLDLNEKILAKTKNDFKYGNLKWNGNVSNLQTVTFKGDSGMPRGSQGAFYYCSYNVSENHRYIPISHMGQVRSEVIKSC